jgi:[protein-PII] uridylyltransferase
LASGDRSIREELERDLLAVLPAPAPAKPVSEAS